MPLNSKVKINKKTNELQPTVKANGLAAFS